MIQVQNLVHYYGALKAVNQINFEVKNGEIVGFLGPNGAGKSTTLKILTGYLSQTSGNIKVNGLDTCTNSTKIRKMIGYLPEHNPLYTESTVYDFLQFIANVREIEQSQFKSSLKKVCEMTGIGNVLTKPIHTLSKGYRQRVGLAQALIHNPDYLILDEPTNGLDPNQIVENRELLKRLGKEKTIIFCSHNLLIVEAICDRVVIINKGQIVANGKIDDLKKLMASQTGLTNPSFEQVFQWLTIENYQIQTKQQQREEECEI